MHRALLNYWCGVEVKGGGLVEALVQSIRKERMAAGLATCQTWRFGGAYGSRRSAMLAKLEGTAVDLVDLNEGFNAAGWSQPYAARGKFEST